jgi:hypothetical protein
MSSRNVDIDEMPYSPSLTTAVCDNPPESPHTLAKLVKMAIPILELDSGHDSDADVQRMDNGLVVKDEPGCGGRSASAESHEAEREERTSAGDELAEEVHHEEKVFDKGVVDDGDNDKSIDVRLVPLSEDTAVSRDDLPANQKPEMGIQKM